jgi:hypothetical protein
MSALDDLISTARHDAKQNGYTYFSNEIIRPARAELAQLRSELSAAQARIAALEEDLRVNDFNLKQRIAQHEIDYCALEVARDALEQAVNEARELLVSPLRAGETMKKSTCPKCKKLYNMGHTGVAEGCDKCIGIKRDKHGYAWYPGQKSRTCKPNDDSPEYTVTRRSALGAG